MMMTTQTQNDLYMERKIKVDYAILSAIPEELEFLMKEFTNAPFVSIKVGEFEFKIFKYLDNNVLISHTGMGTAFAASVLTLIHSYFKPNYFFISGTAGGVKEGLNLCDVIIAEKAFEAEIQDAFEVLKGTPFENCLKHPIKNVNFPAQYSADPELLALCGSIKFDNIIVHKGTVVSSNAFPAPKELFEKIKSFNPYSIDMETSAFYQTAWLLNSKVLAVRGISNILNTDGTDDNVHKSDLQGSSTAAASVVLALLNKSISLKNKLKLLANEHDAIAWIKKLNLQKHLEGGYFAQSFKSDDEVKPVSPRFNDETRCSGTSIYYLLNKDEYSAWHKLKSDEIWHFYKGSAVKLYIIHSENGQLSTHILGDPSQDSNATFQVCIKAGDYFAAENLDKTNYCLAGCTVSPGFEYKDFELAKVDELTAKFPQHQNILERLSSKNEMKLSEPITLHGMRH